jgi:hypothetical protein
MSAGAKASRNGKNFKAQIATTLTVNGFEEITKEEMTDILNGAYCEKRVFAKNVVLGKNIYGVDWRTDFIYFNGNNRFRIIHARWQQVGGSVDEKFPFFVANARKANAKDSIFVLGGDGFKQGARDWLKAQKRHPIIEVFSEEEFQEWANNGNL